MWEIIRDAIAFFQKGGIMMIPLLICSILVLAITLERAVNLRRRKVISPEFVILIENIRGPKDIKLALSLCSRRDGAFSNIIRAGLENRHLPKDELKEAIQDQGRQEVHNLERGLVILETIAGVAPLLGLLGTVIGMVKVFRVISQMGVGQASALSAGISEALITTVVGLSIGIPALIGYNYFTHKAETLVLEIEKYSATLVKRLRSVREMTYRLG